MAKQRETEKRWHCPECAEAGRVNKFVNRAALNMHRQDRHGIYDESVTLRPGPVPVKTFAGLAARPEPTVTQPLEIAQRRGLLSVAWVVAVLLLCGVMAAAMVFRKDIAESWAQRAAHDVDARHD